MDKFKPLDAEERELIDLIENSETHPVSKEKEQQILAALRKNKNRAISLRINENDLAGIKEKAKRAGIPYQTLINSILHRYVAGDIYFKEQV